MSAKPFDSTILVDAAGAFDFITNVLEASAEYSIIGKSLDGTILLWNEGARRLYGYEPEKVVVRADALSFASPWPAISGDGPRERRDPGR